MFRLLRHRSRCARLGSDLRVATRAALCALVAGSLPIFNPQPGRSAGRFGGRPARRPESTGQMLRGFGLALLFTGSLLASLWGSSAQAISHGIQINNTAHVEYAIGGIPQATAVSNTVTMMVRSPATIEFLKYAPHPASGGDAVPVPTPTWYDQGGGDFVAIPPPPTTVNPTVPLIDTPIYYLGETIYLRLTDLDQNTDPAAVESVTITVTCFETGDVEVLRLIETGANTGVFTGYLPTTTSTASLVADGTIVVEIKSRLQATYTDPFDLVQTVTDAALIDPYGFVFDSLTGAQVDGATVTLIDTATGLPAQVFGDDGISNYPATVVTGGTASDSGGQFYQLPTGGFRFPYVFPGTYRLAVTPPAGYSAPSVVPDDRLLVVRPNAVLVTGSRGEPFPVNPGPALRIDYPIDPANRYLWLQKAVNRDQASIGDFLQYRLTLENGSANIIAPAVTINDRLPLGVRYQKGSARLAGIQSGDPAISGDGRTLSFTLGDLAPGSNREITYVAEVAAGAKTGEAVNVAQARDGNNIASNQAKAAVEIIEEFFRDRAILLGRVLTGSCAQDDSAMQGVPGVRLYLEDGTFVVTDKDGRYHFEGVEPGVHVVQVDTATLPPGFAMIPCEETTQFAGRNFSQFVDLRGGALWRVNFYTAPLPPPTGEVSLQLFSTLEGRVATLRAVASANSVPVDNLRVTVMLPGAAEYLPGTTRRDGRSIDDPLVMAGAVTLRTSHLASGETTQFTFQARLAGGDKDSELPAKALLTFDSPIAKNQRTPVADNSFRLIPGVLQSSEQIRLYPLFPTLVATLQPLDLMMLEKLADRLKGQKVERIEVVGHTDNVRIAPHSRHIFADNQALSEARALSIAEFLRQRLNLTNGSITERGMGESMPVADNTSVEGRALNRRVELFIVTTPMTQPPRTEVTKGDSGLQTAVTKGIEASAPAATALKSKPPAPVKPPQLTELLAAASPEKHEIVWPAAGFVPEIANIEVMVRFQRGEQVTLRLNDEDVPVLNFDESKPVPGGNLMMSSWAGVDLRDGRNLLEAVISDASGQEVARLQRDLWFVSTPGSVVMLKEQSKLLADGIHPPVFALRITDPDGHPLRPGLLLEYEVSAPFQALRDETTEDLEKSARTGRMETGADGIAYAHLDPTTQTGEVVITVPTADGPQEVSAWLQPAPREWILVGFADRTFGYNTIKDNMVSAEDAGLDNDYYSDGRVKFFAKGAIKGEWLLTLAYDSDKPNLDGDSLQQIIDPDTYYPLYGDETQQGYEASSARDIYVKLERDQFYALFGDMETGLNQTVLSQYSRSMNGFKSEMQGERFAFTVFAADTKQAFKKDEIRGDGTSGRYPLSSKNLVINSEGVVIETRDRFHNERIIAEVPLSRHVDYDIDYDAGTLWFKRPVPSKDADLNPIFIVVRYETEGSDSAKLNYGGRVAAMVTEQVEVGASLVHEESGDEKGDLYGTDVTVQLTPQTTLRLEAAVTDVKATDDDFKGDAYLAEVEHSGETVSGRAWFRQQDGEFGLGQQNGGTEGMRTYGAQGNYLINPSWNLAGELWHEDNLDSNAKRDVASLQAEYRAERYSLSAGVREARDKFEDGEKQTSRQMLLGGSWRTADGKLNLRANHSQSLGSSNDNVDFPTRTLIGADYQLTRNVSLFAEQEFTWGEETDTEGTRVGIKTTPWQGGEIHTTVEQQINENSERVFALLGLGQNWQVNKNWSIDLTIDRSYTVKNEAVGERVNGDVPPASGGDDDFTAVSMGVAYRALKWSWWNRLETRQGDSEDKVGFSTGLVGEVREGTAISARMMAFITSSADGSKRDEEEITLGMAYRPDRSKWIILEKLDVSLYNESGNGADNDGMRIVNHLHANFRTADRLWQTSFYYGLKYVRENFDGDTFDGYTDMFAVETRYNINKKWDVGLHGAILHSWESNQFDYSLGADVGYLVMTNAWVSAGYNVVGFEDEDFDAASYTAEGPYVKFRMKFDQQSVKEAAEWLNK